MMAPKRTANALSLSGPGPVYAVTSYDAGRYFPLGDSSEPLRERSFDEVNTASMCSSVLNLSNTTLAVSVLAAAYACSHMGLVTYVVTLTIVAFFAQFSVRLLTRCLAMSGKATYAELGYDAFGRAGELVAVASVIVQQLGACIAFISIIGDVLQPLVSHLGALSNVYGVGLGQKLWQVAVGVLIIFPLTMLRRMDSLRFTSFMGLILVIVFVIMVCVDCAYRLTHVHLSIEPLGTTSAPRNGTLSTSLVLVDTNYKGVLSTLPLLCFAYVCHMNVFPIQQELRKPTEARMNIVGTFSIVLCWLLYLVAGIMGYLLFSNGSTGDILQSYDTASTIGALIFTPALVLRTVRFGLGLALIFAFPLSAFELRRCVDNLFFPHQMFSWVRHTILNLMLMAVAIVVALLVPKIVLVIGFTGASTSALIVFVLPAAFFLKFDRARHRRSASPLCRKLLAWSILLVGIAFIPASIVAISLNLAALAE